MDDVYDTHYFIAELKDRGWTTGLIEKLLGDPDVIKSRYGGGTIKYYDCDRVEAQEASETYVKRQKSLENLRVKRAKRAIEDAIKRDKERIELAKTTPVHIDPIRKTDFHSFVDVRHEHTNYDEVWRRLDKTPEAYLIWCRRLAAAVQARWPYKSEEIQDWLDKKEEEN